jgi:hypothetical protein
VFIKLKPGKYGIKLCAAEAKNCYACNMQVYTGKSGGEREKKQGLQVANAFHSHKMWPEVSSSVPHIVKS